MLDFLSMYLVVEDKQSSHSGIVHNSVWAFIEKNLPILVGREVAFGYLYNRMCAQSDVFTSRISSWEPETVDGRFTCPNDKHIPGSSNL